MAGNAQNRPLEPGLHLVATPIGSARDITLRALDTLVSADVLAAEDTRTLRKLMEIHGIAPGERPVISYHDHNGAAVRPRLLAAMEEGRSVAYASEAGTPLVADPGFALARAAVERGLSVTAVPGPSAVLAALSVSALPSDRFLFAGFLPPAAGARRRALEELAAVPATLIFFESPRRCSQTVREMVSVLGEDRQAALCRELTKKFEEVRRGTLGDLAMQLERDGAPKGEVVLVVDRGKQVASAQQVEAALQEALKTMRVKDAARQVAEELGLSRREVYQAALALAGKK